MDDFDRTTAEIKAASLTHLGKPSQALGYGSNQRGAGGGGGTPAPMIRSLPAPQRFTDRTRAQLGPYGLQADRDDFWGSNWDPAGWANLRNDGISWWRFTHYGMWRAELQSLRDGYVNNVDFFEHDVVLLRRSTTSTGKVIMQLEGRSYILPENSPIRVNAPVSFGSLVIPTSVDYASNVSAGAFLEDFNIWDFGQANPQPNVTAWASWDCSVREVSCVRVSIFKCSTSHAPGSTLLFATNVTYGAYTLPAMTTLTVRTSASTVGDAQQLAVGVFKIPTGSAVTTVSSQTAFRLKTLHNNFYRDNVSLVRYPLDDCVSIMNDIQAAGLKVWWGGNHSNVFDSIDDWGIDVIKAMETQMYAWMAQQNWNPDNVVVALEAEAVWDYEEPSTTEVRQARWNRYRDELLTWRVQTIRQYLPEHTISYHYPNYPAAYGLAEYVDVIANDTNVYAVAHVYPNTFGVSLSPLTTPGAYSTIWSSMNKVQQRGLRMAISEHGHPSITSSTRAELLGYGAAISKFYEAPICFWAAGNAAYTSGVFTVTTSAAGKSARLTPAMRAVLL